MGSFNCEDDFYSKKFSRIFINAEKKNIPEADMLRLQRALWKKADEAGMTKGDFNALIKANRARKTEKQSDQDDLTPSNLPDWVIVKEGRQGVTLKIHEPKFSEWFTQKNNLVQINETFYMDGEKIDDGTVLKMIQEQIEPYIIEGTGKKTKDLILTVGNNCRKQQPLPDTGKIYCGDGMTLTIDNDGNITPVNEDVFTLTRLPVRYNPSADCPVFRDKYLADLFYEEDLPALQEFIGYCLIPSTRAQAGLFIYGKGGEGKSVLRTILKRLFGHAAIQEAIHALSEKGDGKFNLANLENKLVCIDDDMRTELLSGTETIKKLITAEAEMLVEEKFKSKRETFLYSRIVAIGNSHIGSKFDHSDGFYRRQLLIDVKPVVRKESEIDRYMSDKCCDELEGILNWALKGLQRLIRNKFNFSISDRMKKNLDSTRHENDNVLAFVEDESAVTVTGMFYDSVTTDSLWIGYLLWCKANGETHVVKRTFTTRLAEMFREQKSKKVPSAKGTLVNGYFEMKLTDDLMQQVNTADQKEIDSILREK